MPAATGKADDPIVCDCSTTCASTSSAKPVGSGSTAQDPIDVTADDPINVGDDDPINVSDSSIEMGGAVGGDLNSRPPSSFPPATTARPDTDAKKFLGSDLINNQCIGMLVGGTNSSNSPLPKRKRVHAAKSTTLEDLMTTSIVDDWSSLDSNSSFLKECGCTGCKRPICGICLNCMSKQAPLTPKKKNASTSCCCFCFCQKSYSRGTWQTLQRIALASRKTTTDQDSIKKLDDLYSEVFGRQILARKTKLGLNYGDEAKVDQKEATRLGPDSHHNDHQTELDACPIINPKKNKLQRRRCHNTTELDTFGNQVYARWLKNDSWYPGTIIDKYQREKQRGMRFTIQFDDGDTRKNVPETDFISGELYKEFRAQENNDEFVSKRAEYSSTSHRYRLLGKPYCQMYFDVDYRCHRINGTIKRSQQRGHFSVVLSEESWSSVQLSGCTAEEFKVSKEYAWGGHVLYLFHENIRVPSEVPFHCSVEVPHQFQKKHPPQAGSSNSQSLHQFEISLGSNVKLLLFVGQSSIVGAGLGVWLHYQGLEEFFSLAAGHLIDLGVYAPMLASDRKPVSVCLLKDFLFDFSCASWSYDTGVKGSSDLFDITNDFNGELHETAKRNLLVYTNEIASAKEIPSIHAWYDAEGKLHFVLGHTDQKHGALTFVRNIPVELKVDYCEHYEMIRVHKKYPRVTGEQLKSHKDKIEKFHSELLLEWCSYPRASILQLTQFMTIFMREYTIQARSNLETVRVLIILLVLHRREPSLKYLLCMFSKKLDDQVFDEVRRLFIQALAYAMNLPVQAVMNMDVRHMRHHIDNQVL